MHIILIKVGVILKNVEKQTKMLYNVSLLNSIAIILVILGHSGCVYTGKWGGQSVFYNNSSIIRYITCYIYSFHMPLFVFISGYLYCYGKNTQNKYQSLQALIGKKIEKTYNTILDYRKFFHVANIYDFSFR